MLDQPPLTAAVFLDKDGTLIEDVPYNVNPVLIQFTFGAIAGLQRLHRAGYGLFVVTNQSGVARGYFSQAELKIVEQHLRYQLAKAEIPLRGFYACPHHPEGIIQAYRQVCDCRKPQPGLLYQAAAAHAIDLSRSWMVGDILHDIEAGRIAGCRTILIDNGNETEWQLTRARLPHHSVRNLWEATQIILATQSSDISRELPCHV